MNCIHFESVSETTGSTLLFCGMLPVLVGSSTNEKAGRVIILQNGEEKRTMTIQNVDIDYCGIINLLHQLVTEEICTEGEAKKIAARIAAQLHTTIILPFPSAVKG